MKNIITALVIVFSMTGISFAGECVTGNCTLRNRTVNVTKEIIAVPVEVTRRTVESTRQVGRRTLARTRNIVR
jgi:hypothetical protein